MRQASLRVSAAVLVLAFLLISAAPLAAQEAASPTAIRTDWTGTPPPADCTFAPAVLEDLIGILATPVAMSELETFPIVVETEALLPVGGEPTAEELNAASETYWRSIACLNAGDTPRFASSFSPAGFNLLITTIYQAAGRAPSPFSAVELTQIGTTLAPSFTGTPQTVAPEMYSRIERIRDATRLPDGRIMIFVDGRGADGQPAATYAVMRRAGEIWLIDAFGLIGSLAPATASPTT